MNGNVSPRFINPCKGYPGHPDIVLSSTSQGFKILVTVGIVWQAFHPGMAALTQMANPSHVRFISLACESQSFPAWLTSKSMFFWFSLTFYSFFAPWTRCGQSTPFSPNNPIPTTNYADSIFNFVPRREFLQDFRSTALSKHYVCLCKYTHLNTSRGVQKLRIPIYKLHFICNMITVYTCMNECLYTYHHIPKYGIQRISKNAQWYCPIPGVEEVGQSWHDPRRHGWEQFLGATGRPKKVHWDSAVCEVGRSCFSAMWRMKLRTTHVEWQ
jgi:hypothetical protein